MCFAQTIIEAVISLILCFVAVSSILWFFHIDFLAVSYLIVYVGAIAILFLFVIMITPIKTNTLSNDISGVDSSSFDWIKYIGSNTFFIFIFIVLIIILTIYLPESLFKSFFVLNIKYNLNILFFIEELSVMNFLAQSLFNFFSLNVLICGFILLIGLIGCILPSLNNIIIFNLKSFL